MSDSHPYDQPPPPPPPSWLPPGAPPPPPPLGVSRTGPPWEQDGPAVRRFTDTAKGVLLDPQRTFDTMRREGGLQMPLAYAAIGVGLGAIVSAFYRLLLSGISLGTFGAMPLGAEYASVSVLSALILAPVVAVAVAFLLAGIYHVLLLLLDAARFPFETTFRVQAYVLGSTALLAVVPFCGNVIGFVWALAAAIVGLSRAHEVPAGKAAIAVLVPTLLCCFFVLMAMVLFGLSALALMGAMR